MLKELGRRTQPKSYLWAQINGGAGPPIRLFTYTQGRGGEHAELLFAGIRSGTVLMSDGYSLYNSIAHDYQLMHNGMLPSDGACAPAIADECLNASSSCSSRIAMALCRAACWARPCST